MANNLNSGLGRAVTGVTRFRVTRTGGGAFTLSVGGLKALSTGQWCEVVYNGSGYTLVAYGTL